MNSNRIRASVFTALAAIVLAGMAAGGASAAEPVSHSAGTVSVVHVSGSNVASTTTHETTAFGGALVAIELAY